MRNWLYLALVCTLVFAAAMILDKQPNDARLPQEGDGSAFERFPYAVLHDARTKHFDDDGTLSYEFDAVTLKHFRAHSKKSSEQDYILITAPQLTLYGEPQPWLVTAKHGRVSDHGTHLELWDSVRVWQDKAGSNNERTELTTQRIDIFPNEKRIRTEEQVQITSPSGHISSKGLEVDIKKQRIILLANVRGVHEPIR